MHRMGKIIEFLGRKPSKAEYNRIWRMFFTEEMVIKKEALRRQRQRHLNHTGPANAKRKFCIYCEKRS